MTIYDPSLGDAMYMDAMARKNDPKIADLTQRVERLEMVVKELTRIVLSR